MIALLTPFFAMKLLKARVTLQCADCGAEQTTYRWELKLPDWIGFRAPGIHWRTGVFQKAGETRTECAAHTFSNLAAEIGTTGGPMRLSCTCDTDTSPTINGKVTTIDTSVNVLWQAMNPRNSSTGVSCSPKVTRGAGTTSSDLGP